MFYILLVIIPVALVWLFPAQKGYNEHLPPGDPNWEPPKETFEEGMARNQLIHEVRNRPRYWS